MPDPNSMNSSIGRSRGGLLTGSNGLGGETEGKAGEDEIESCDLDLVVDRFLDAGRGDKSISIGNTVSRIWGTTSTSTSTSTRKNKSRSSKQSIDRHTSRLNSISPAGGEIGETGWNSPTSESDSTTNIIGVHHGFGRNVLKGVKERAGRAGRKFGDNLG